MHLYMSCRETLKLAREHIQREDAGRQAQIDLETRQLLLEEFCMGLITKDDYWKMAYSKPTSHTSTKDCSPSPEWDIEHGDHNSEYSG